MNIIRKPYILGIGLLSITLLIVAGAFAATLESSTHRSNSSTTDWEQYKIECSLDNCLIYNIYVTEHSGGEIDGYGLLLGENGWLQFRLYDEDLDFGCYRIIVVMDVMKYVGEDTYWCDDPIDIEFNIGYHRYYETYLGSHCQSPSNGAPYNQFLRGQGMAGTTTSNPTPHDFGLFYFPKGNIVHDIYIANRDPDYDLFIDEIIITPA